MTFSIIVPVFNCRIHLKACIHSILDSQIQSFEILLIDDGSTDGSAELCDELSRSHPCIHAIHQPHSGVSAARNAGLTKAAGEYILFVDGDDTLKPIELKQVLENPVIAKADLTIFGMTFLYFHRGQLTKTENHVYSGDPILPEEAWNNSMVEMFRANALSSICNKVFRREIIESNHLRLNPSLILYEDLDFVLRYLRYCKTIGNLACPVYQYHLTEISEHAKYRMTQVDCISEFLIPFEHSLNQLRLCHPGISEKTCSMLLQMLNHILLVGKLSVTQIGELPKLCKQEQRIVSASSSAPQLQFPGKMLCLWIKQKTGTLRHRLGIEYRWLLSWLRKEPYGY